MYYIYPRNLNGVPFIRTRKKKGPGGPPLSSFYLARVKLSLQPGLDRQHQQQAPKRSHIHRVSDEQRGVV